MDISTYLANKVIDHMLRNQSYTPPSTIYLSAHTGDPFSGNEVGTAVSGTPGSGEYNRTALELDAAASKATANTNAETLTMPPAGFSDNTLVLWLGIYDAQTGGNLLARSPLNVGSPLEVTADTADLFTSAATHSLSAGDRVVFSDGGSGLPTGLSADTVYFVISSGLTTTAFKVSATAGGSAVDITAAGGAIVRKLRGQPMNAGNVLQVPAGSLTITL